MRLPSSPLKAVLLAAIILIAAATGLSLASTDPDQDELASSSSSGKQLALGKAQVAASSRRVGGAIGRARATGSRKTRSGLGAPPASAPGLLAAAPAPAAAPGAQAPSGSGPAPEPPAAPEPAPEPPAEPAPPAAEPPVEPTPPEPTPSDPPAPPVVTPPTPSPPSQPKPTPGPPPKPSTPDPPPKPSPPDPPPPVTPDPPPPVTPDPPPPDVDPGVPLEPPVPTPKSSLVLGIDGGYAGWSAPEVKQRTALDAAVTRHEWDISNPVTSEEDQVLAAATEFHSRILALLGGNDLGDAAHYRDWVIGFIRHYGPGGAFWAAHPGLNESRYAIDTIELGNEPYFGEMSAEDYADTVRPTLEEIKRLDLPVKVLLPVYLHGDDVSWIDTLYERIPDLNSLYYAGAFHPYWYGHDPSEPGDSSPLGRMQTLRQRLNELGAEPKPIYLTEYGESTADCGGECVSEAVQAEHLEEMLEAVITNSSWKVGLLSVFQLIDRGTNSSDRELQFGLLRENGTPKPAYAIIRAAMQLYR
ncbi:MAG TPA: hypothetical protein VFI03_07475 [Solirubrobacterales bacterium]|nr:hypothetical protein [Solirubrobacterales bacterium]